MQAHFLRSTGLPSRSAARRNRRLNLVAAAHVVVEVGRRDLQARVVAPWSGIADHNVHPAELVERPASWSAAPIQLPARDAVAGTPRSGCLTRLRPSGSLADLREVCARRTWPTDRSIPSSRLTTTTQAALPARTRVGHAPVGFRPVNANRLLDDFCAGRASAGLHDAQAPPARATGRAGHPPTVRRGAC